MSTTPFPSGLPFFQLHDVAGSTTLLVADGLDAIAKCQDRLRNRRWHTLATVQRDMQGLRSQLLSCLVVSSSMLTSYDELASSEAEVLQRSIRRLQRRLAETSVSDARQFLVDHSPEGADVDALLEALPDIDTPLRQSFHRRHLKHEFDLLRLAEVLPARLATWSARASIQGAMGQGYRRVKRSPTVSQDVRGVTILDLRERAGFLQRGLQRTIDELHQLLVEEDADEAAYVALCGKADVVAHDGVLTDLAARTGATIALLGRPRNEPAAAEVWPQLLPICDALRDAALVRAYCSYAIARGLSTRDPRWFDGEIRRAIARRPGTLAFPLVADPAMIVGSPGDSPPLVVEGIVEALGIVADPAPPKFSTLMTLRRLDDRTRTVVRGHMLSLENDGVAVGSYVRLAGHDRGNPLWANGSPGFELDRFSLDELRESSWIHDIAWRLRRMKVFDRYRNNAVLVAAPIGPL